MKRLLLAGVALLALAGEAKSQVIGDRDLECLAYNVYMEGRDQSFRGRLAIAHVTLNRLREGFAKTVCAVVYQPGAFSWTGAQPQSWQKPITLTDLRGWDWAKYIAVLAVTDPDGDPTFGSTYYHEKKVAPEWRRSFQRVATIGDHVFYQGE